MTNKQQICVLCGESTNNELSGFLICSKCKSTVGLMSEETFQKHCLDRSAFKKEAQEKLEILEKDYARKKIKLLDILKRLG